MKKREAFEKWYSTRMYASRFAPAIASDAFEAGYAAAIEAVKAGGVQGRGGVCFDGPLLYKLPEEMK